jgi:hypothetical protein
LRRLLRVAPQERSGQLPIDYHCCMDNEKRATGVPKVAEIFAPEGRSCN